MRAQIHLLNMIFLLFPQIRNEDDDDDEIENKTENTHLNTLEQDGEDDSRLNDKKNQ